MDQSEFYDPVFRQGDLVPCHVHYKNLMLPHSTVLVLIFNY